MSEEVKPTSLSGVTAAYSGNGRKLGYPTANISSNTKLADGVYFGFASLGEYLEQPALIFIGTPTTVGDQDRRVEAHLLDIKDVDYYGQKLGLNILHYHRPSQTFDGLDELIDHIKADEIAGREWFKSYKKATVRREK